MSTTDEPWYEGKECVDCDEPLENTGYPEDSDYVQPYGNGSFYEAVREDAEGYLCLYCKESWDEHANTLVVVHEDGSRSKVAYQSGRISDQAVHNADFVPVPDSPHEGVILDVVGGTEWVSTDAWRGYESGPSSPGGWGRVENSWHGTVTKTDASERINDLSAGDGPRPVAVAFTKTSNVMSMGIEVYAPEDVADDVTAFFEGASAGLDGGRFGD